MSRNDAIPTCAWLLVHILGALDVYIPLHLYTALGATQLLHTEITR
jgi:hypothetical protein